MAFSRLVPANPSNVPQLFISDILETNNNYINLISKNKWIYF